MSIKVANYTIAQSIEGKRHSSEACQEGQVGKRISSPSQPFLHAWRHGTVPSRLAPAVAPDATEAVAARGEPSPFAGSFRS